MLKGVIQIEVESTSVSIGLSKKFVHVLLWDVMEITYNNNLKTYQEIKNNDEGNYTGKYENQYYYTLVITPPIGFKKVNELNSNYKSMLMSTQCIKI